MSLKSWKEILPGGIIVDSGNSRETKTGSWRIKKPQINSKECIKCKKCIAVCPENSISADSENEILIDYDYCKGCNICASVCPKDAIKLELE